MKSPQFGVMRAGYTGWVLTGLEYVVTCGMEADYDNQVQMNDCRTNGAD